MHGHAEEMMRSTRKSLLIQTASIVALLTGLASPVDASMQLPELPTELPTDHELLLLELAGVAKAFCSGVFVSGREVEEIREHTASTVLERNGRRGPHAGGELVRIEVDRENEWVQASIGEIVRTARFYGDQGCVILPVGSSKVFFTPVEVETMLPAADRMPWPMGEPDPGGPLGIGVNAKLLRSAVAAAFEPKPDNYTAAFLVVHRGRLIAEKYAKRAHEDMELQSWSMGKSVTATLVGLLIQDGHFGLWDPAPVPEWHRRPGDPRSEIRIADLLRMSSGLGFVSAYSPDYEPEMGYPDHFYMYDGAVDVFQLTLSRPQQYPPNTFGGYKNGDPLTLGRIVRRTVEEELGEEYLAWPQKALFDKIGIRKFTLETDPYGNFVLTDYNFGRPRDWARLGMLYLQDGVWEGERRLPEGFVEFVSTPAPAWKEPVYGGLFWINGNGEWNLPRNAYRMSGAGGQMVWIVPDQELVVVRMGHMRGWEQEHASAPLNNALAKLMTAIGAEDAIGR